MENIFIPKKKDDWPLRDIFLGYLEEIKPLLKTMGKGQTETDNFKISIVFKCNYSVAGCLDHDWIKLKESSLNEKDFRKKIFEVINSYTQTSGAVHDLYKELEWNNEYRFENKILSSVEKN